MWAYRTLYVFDTLAVLVLAYFFLDGLRYASDASYYALWLPILAVPVTILAAAPVLRRRSHHVAALVLVIVLAIPPVAFVPFFGFLLALNPRWN